MILLVSLGLAQQWQAKPYGRPIGAMSSFGGARALTLGAEGGFIAMQPSSLLATQTRAQVAYHLYPGGGGHDARLGSFWGPWHEFFSLMAGPDLFRNSFRTDREVLLRPSLGLDLPVMVRLGPQELHVSAALVPSWLVAKDRRADLPVVHEFEWRVGLVVQGPISFGVYYSRRTTVFGVQEGLGVGVGL